MMIHERTRVRYHFTCHRCEYDWAADYDVDHVEDGHGHGVDYYLQNGIPVVSPLAADTVPCPQCGERRVGIRSHLAARP